MCKMAAILSQPQCVKPMLIYSQLLPWEQTSIRFEPKKSYIRIEENSLKMLFVKCWSFWLKPNKLMAITWPAMHKTPSMAKISQQNKSRFIVNTALDNSLVMLWARICEGPVKVEFRPFNPPKKIPPYRHRNPHYKSQVVWRPSEIYHGNPHVNKMISSEWIEAQGHWRTIALNHWGQFLTIPWPWEK